MATHVANEDPRPSLSASLPPLSSPSSPSCSPAFWLSLWLRVREFAVPPSMIETATARRRVGDWAGACAASHVDVDLGLRSVARRHGRELASRVRADLRHLAPDLLRWHMPRIAPDGLLRPGLTVTLARYEVGDGDGVPTVHLVARTAPAWADAGQRISLALWEPPGPAGPAGPGTGAHPRPHHHPHPHPSRRFRLDLHRHLWDARRAGELRLRSAAERPAVDRWAAEAAILLRAERRASGSVLVRLGARRRLLLDLAADGGDRAGPPTVRITAAPRHGRGRAVPVLPDAATWAPPDVELLRAGLITPDRLHPLVAEALAPGGAPAGTPRTGHGAATPSYLVECRGEQHRIGLVDGALAALDHDPDEVRREELLAALTGTPLPCLRVIDELHRSPDSLSGIREQLRHGDVTGALAVVEGLLGPEARLREGELRDELEAAARRRVVHGLFRAGLVGPGPRSGRNRPATRRPADHLHHPRHATAR
ncbi:hypothetical protein ACTWP5_20960 [Streptomyces sp. 4N509B]|uniref:hypothetical protein n=1 Tax=Streptomyces sp. 4N509B TaxID=3457413 RepID=UPI003FD3450F